MLLEACSLIRNYQLYQSVTGQRQGYTGLPHSRELRMAKKPNTESIAQEVIEEARMVLPGIQALFGFQLIAVFNERFRDLETPEQRLHYAALILVAAAIAIIMTPGAYHRIAEQTTVSDFSSSNWPLGLSRRQCSR
jgi:hypothetical protein